MKDFEVKVSTNMGVFPVRHTYHQTDPAPHGLKFMGYARVLDDAGAPKTFCPPVQLYITPVGDYIAKL